MAGNKLKVSVLDVYFRGATIPTNLYIALVTDTPTADTDTLGELTEMATGNGYDSGGFQLTPNSTDFDSLVENDTDDRAELQIKDVEWLAVGGTIPSSGSVPTYAVMTDDNATVANREVFVFWELGVVTTLSVGDTLLLQDLELRLS